MRGRPLLAIGGFFVAAIVVWWLLFWAGPRWFRDPAPDAPVTAGGAGTTADPQRRITATLFYVSDDGMALLPAQREVPFAEPVVEQARQVVLAQIAPVEAPLASAVPPGTSLRAIFLSEKGDLFVDLELWTHRSPTCGNERQPATQSCLRSLTSSVPSTREPSRSSAP
jgi:hypothetical protein